MLTSQNSSLSTTARNTSLAVRARSTSFACHGRTLVLQIPISVQKTTGLPYYNRGSEFLKELLVMLRLRWNLFLSTGSVCTKPFESECFDSALWSSREFWSSSGTLCLMEEFEGFQMFYNFTFKTQPPYGPNFQYNSLRRPIVNCLPNT